MEDILFEVVEDQLTNEMFTDDMALYVEMMEDNYHTSPIVGLAWGNNKKIYTTNNLAVFESQPFIDWLMDETRKKCLRCKTDVRCTKSLCRKMTGIAFDVLFAYLLDTNDNNADIEGVAQHYGYDAIQSDEAIYGKGPKRLARGRRSFRSFST